MANDREEFERRRRRRNIRIVVTQQITAIIPVLVILWFVFKDADFENLNEKTIFFPWLAMLACIYYIHIFSNWFWPPESTTPPDIENSEASIGNPGLTTRIVIFVCWNTLLGIVIWKFMTFYLPGLGDYIHWMTLIGILTLSILTSFDADTIKPNHKGQILYWGHVMFSDLTPGLTLLGPPRLIGQVSIRSLSDQLRQYTIGTADSPFIVEVGTAYTADIRVTLSVDIDRIDAQYQTEGDAKAEEKALVEITVAAIRRIINTKVNGKLPFETIEDLKGGGKQIRDAIFHETDENGVLAQFLLRGYKLRDLSFAKINDGDKRVLAAKRLKEARTIEEEIERIDNKNSVDKIRERLAGMLADLNITVDEFKAMSYKERKEMYESAKDSVERGENRLTTIQSRGGGIVPIVDINRNNNNNP